MNLGRRVLEQSGPSKILSKRDSLKIQLHQERLQYSVGLGWAVVCPLCKKRIEGVGDLHEALVSRGKARGVLQERIFTRYNCVEVHQACHAQLVGAGGREAFFKCAEYLIRWEGYLAIKEWLEDLSLDFPDAAEEALRRLKVVAEG